MKATIETEELRKYIDCMIDRFTTGRPNRPPRAYCNDILHWIEKPEERIERYL